MPCRGELHSSFLYTDAFPYYGTTAKLKILSFQKLFVPFKIRVQKIG
jgi:hypothetical protein